jgi:hypothetical protein
MMLDSEYITVGIQNMHAVNPIASFVPEVAEFSSVLSKSGNVNRRQ